MGWQDFYTRRDVMAEVLRRAEADPAGPLPYAEVPDARNAFADETALLRALYYRWNQILSGYLRAALVEPEAAGASANRDAPDAVTTAWRAAERDHPTLRAVLDANLDRYPGALRELRETELRLIAVTSGLAEPTDSPEEIVGVGNAFLSLMRAAPRPKARRRNPVDHLIRLLAPSA